LDLPKDKYRIIWSKTGSMAKRTTSAGSETTPESNSKPAEMPITPVSIAQWRKGHGPKQHFHIVGGAQVGQNLPVKIAAESNSLYGFHCGQVSAKNDSTSAFSI